MNLLLLTPEEVNAGCLWLAPSDRRSRHLSEVIRPETGDRLRVGCIGGLMGEARAQRLEDGGWKLDMLTLNQPPPSPLPVTVVLALPRPKALRRIIQGLTALGVKKLWLIHSYRVEKSYWQAPWLEPEALREQCLLGLEQARDTVLPEIGLRRRFKPFVEDELPGLIAERGQGHVAHPYPEQPSPPPERGAGTVLVFGPEGGFIPYEVNKLVEAGCQAFSLGPRILRVETVLPTVIGKLYY